MNKVEATIVTLFTLFLVYTYSGQVTVTKVYASHDFECESDPLTGMYHLNGVEYRVNVVVDKTEDGMYFLYDDDHVYHMHIVGDTNMIMLYELVGEELVYDDVNGRIVYADQYTSIVIEGRTYTKVNMYGS
jgi:hypothetical protein